MQETKGTCNHQLLQHVLTKPFDLSRDARDACPTVTGALRGTSLAIHKRTGRQSHSAERPRPLCLQLARLERRSAKKRSQKLNRTYLDPPSATNRLEWTAFIMLPCTVRKLFLFAMTCSAIWSSSLRCISELLGRCYKQLANSWFRRTFTQCFMRK